MARCRSKKSTELLKLKNYLILLRPLKTANIVTEIKPNDLKRLFIVDVMTHCQDCQWCPFQADIQDNGVGIAGCGRADKPLGQPSKRDGMEAT